MVSYHIIKQLGHARCFAKHIFVASRFSCCIIRFTNNSTSFPSKKIPVVLSGVGHQLCHLLPHRNRFHQDDMIRV